MDLDKDVIAENFSYFSRYVQNSFEKRTKPNQYLGDCPRCKTPKALAFNTEKGLFICNSCGVSGNRNSFIEKMGLELNLKNPDISGLSNKELTIPLSEGMALKVRIEIICL